MRIRPHVPILLILAGFSPLLWPSAAGAPAANQDKGETKETEASQHARESKDKASTTLRIEVTAGEKAVPVDSASVYVRYRETHLIKKNKTIEMNVKTNREGISKLPGVPRGKVLIQVIAPGWKTFGQWYELTQDEQTIKIILQKPPHWY